MSKEIFKVQADRVNGVMRVNEFDKNVKVLDFKEFIAKLGKL